MFAFIVKYNIKLYLYIIIFFFIIKNFLVIYLFFECECVIFLRLYGILGMCAL
jgi:hypothetical protein